MRSSSSRHQSEALTRSRRSPALSKSFPLPMVEWNTRAVFPVLPVQVLTQATGRGINSSFTASPFCRPISGCPMSSGVQSTGRLPPSGKVR